MSLKTALILGGKRHPQICKDYLGREYIYDPDLTLEVPKNWKARGLKRVSDKLLNKAPSKPTPTHRYLYQYVDEFGRITSAQIIQAKNVPGVWEAVFEHDWRDLKKYYKAAGITGPCQVFENESDGSSVVITKL